MTFVGRMLSAKVSVVDANAAGTSFAVNALRKRNSNKRNTKTFKIRQTLRPAPTGPTLLCILNLRLRQLNFKFTPK